MIKKKEELYKNQYMLGARKGPTTKGEQGYSLALVVT